MTLKLLLSPKTKMDYAISKPINNLILTIFNKSKEFNQNSQELMNRFSLSPNLIIKSILKASYNPQERLVTIISKNRNILIKLTKPAKHPLKDHTLNTIHNLKLYPSNQTFVT